MDIKALHSQMTKYNRWKRQLDNRLQRFADWGDSYNMLSEDVKITLQKARNILRGDSFTIACVGEFSRGKTELINALLYSDGGQRLLPSQPGRTTMCPTEIYWDAQTPTNCVRLLPIETRRTKTTIQNFKRIPQNWVTLSFDPNSPSQTRSAINSVSASKWVTPSEAVLLGFSKEELGARDKNGKVAIPAWRHALISLDHPLLRQGLRILDTPGLNALGNEPELTLKSLPEAQAILFLLSADAGVTASDMKIWREHVQVLREEKCTSVLTLLNKIDSLWDDLLPASDVDANIENIRLLTAQQLNLDTEQVVALSAKQGLMGKVSNNLVQLERSNFLQLERKLGDVVHTNQQQIVGHRLIGDAYSLIINTRNSLSKRLTSCELEIHTLRTTAPQLVNATLGKARESIRKSHHQYHKQALSLRTSQRLLESQRTALLSPISLALLERRIGAVHLHLEQSWTTMGLASAITEFFDDVDSTIKHVEHEIDRANAVMASIYQRPEHNLHSENLVMKHLLKIHRQRSNLRQLSKRADDFKFSLKTLFTRKNALINRFISTLIQEVRYTYRDLNEHIEQWLQEALLPLMQDNNYQKQLLEQHMMRLTQMQSQRNGHLDQIEELQTNIYQLNTALTALEPLYQETINAPLDEPLESTNLFPSSAQVVSLSEKRKQLGSK